MKKENFEKSGICEKKVNEIIGIAFDGNDRSAFRIIKRENADSLLEQDFYPTIMEYNGYVMPMLDKQENKDVGKFGVSVFDTRDNLLNFKETVNSLRKYNVIAKGVVDKNKGCVGVFEENGHYQYFLYDPVDNNPISDFKIYKEGDE